MRLRTAPKLIVTACFFNLFAMVATAEQNNIPPSGFRTLFNGRDLANWHVATSHGRAQPGARLGDDRSARKVSTEQNIGAGWTTNGGILSGNEHNSRLATKEDFGDFELWIDWTVGAKGDSGIYLRGVPQVRLRDRTDAKDSSPAANTGSGGLWSDDHVICSPSLRGDKPAGEWNRMYVRMVGPFVTVRLNDKTVIDNVDLQHVSDPSQRVPLAGPIALQSRSGKTSFRNVFIRRLSEEESAEILAQRHGGEKGFRSQFNGKDFANWQGPIQSYEIANGALRCKPDQEGVLLTKETFDNFVVRLEFKLSPGGNNGLAIRSALSDEVPAYDAFEIQVLDDSAEKYASLQPYQYHGSLYGLAPATRGYLRPQGKWNYEEATISGDRFQVELNGFEILNVALRDLPAQPIDGKPHPGMTRRSGNFGFCSHHDPVEFRSIRIKRLPAEPR
jgi:hypothetical protein